MNTAVAHQQTRTMKPTSEQHIRGNKAEVIQYRMPRKPPPLMTDELGKTYVSLPRSVMGGEIEYRLYGIDCQRQIDEAVDTNVRLLICAIICASFGNDQKKRVRVEMQVVTLLAPTHRLDFYVQRSYTEKPGHVYNYNIPQTNGGFEIIKL